MTNKDRWKGRQVCTEEERVCLNQRAGRCDATHPNKSIVCTREPGHKGNHIACSFGDHPEIHNYEVWRDRPVKKKDTHSK